MKRPTLEIISWIAGIISCVVALIVAIIPTAFNLSSSPASPAASVATPASAPSQAASVATLALPTSAPHAVATTPANPRLSVNPRKPFSNAVFHKAAMDTLTLFDDGKPAVVEGIQECYAAVQSDIVIEHLAACFTADVVAYNFDAGFAKVAGILPDPFFSVDNGYSRVRTALTKVYGMSDDEAWKLVDSWLPHIHQAYRLAGELRQLRRKRQQEVPASAPAE
jgi:hypothetical protein